MKNKSCKSAKRPVCVLLTLLLLTVFALPAWADIGPKPSVTVVFDGLMEQPCYATLLSEEESTGPYSFDPERQSPSEWMVKGDEEMGPLAWRAFHDYRDEDGYFFLEWFQKLDENQQLSWTYFPPERFKVLLYFPDSGIFCKSAVCESYAFDSRFSADLENGGITLHKSYAYGWELASLLVRIAATIALEMALALLFGYASKQALAVILQANLVTQIALNLALNLINFSRGQYAFVFWYLVLEWLVFAAEGLWYCRRLPKQNQGRRSHPVLYAFLANLLSFGAGLGLAVWIPGIF